TAAHSSGTEQFIVDALRAADALTVSLVATRGDTVVGHVAVSPVSISDGSEGWFGLGPISVAPHAQRCGIGSTMMHAALTRLRTIRAAGCVLLGDPGYYERFGFAPMPNLVLPDVPSEYFQAICLSGSIPKGVVSYHPAFSTEATA
ncbi:MAG: N-acetyltransferase, partial [Pseudomonadota bacterium]